MPRGRPALELSQSEQMERRREHRRISWGKSRDRKAQSQVQEAVSALEDLTLAQPAPNVGILFPDLDIPTSKVEDKVMEDLRREGMEADSEAAPLPAWALDVNRSILDNIRSPLDPAEPAEPPETGHCSPAALSLNGSRSQTPSFEASGRVGERSSRVEERTTARRDSPVLSSPLPSRSLERKRPYSVGDGRCSNLI
jgi:hypothetical protein